MIQLSMMLQSMFDWAVVRLERQEGQDFIEYGIILAVIVAACVGVYVTLGGAISGALTTMGGTISGAVGGA